MRLAVLNIVGLSPSLIGPHTPALRDFAARGGMSPHRPAFPAVTCTAQSSILTGSSPAGHGIVGNGWYDRESAEVRFWKQSNHLVRGEKIWDRLARELPGFTCAKLFWWYNMYARVDFSATPRPLYPADGRKVFDIHTQPMLLRDELKCELGEFPFPSFWGPGAGIPSSEWIAFCARHVEERRSPTLSLVYLPHLDYSLQKLGPESPEIPGELAAIDRVAGELIGFYESRGVRVVVLSEYGISQVRRPLHLNRLFRAKGWLQIKDELGRETMDCGSSRVFAVADHQVAHIYIQDGSLANEVRDLVAGLSGVAGVRTPERAWGGADNIAAARGGDLIAVAEPDSWFTYYYWEDDARAPDYARTVDIHRKPGYDPCELFIDPELSFPRLKIAGFLLRKKLGLRGLLDVVPLDAGLVKGSHGSDLVTEELWPVVMGLPEKVERPEQIEAALRALVLERG